MAISKQQRELLILFAILVVMGGIFYMRFGGGGGGRTPNPQLTQLSSGRPGPGVAPGAGTPGQPATFQNQFPIEFLRPGLSDSAVVARILAGTVPNPFAKNHLRQPRTTPRSNPVRETRTVQRDTVEVPLDSWPEGIRYRSVTPVLNEPGVYSAYINGQALRVGDEIPGTGFRLVEVSPLIIRIRKVETAGNVTTITTYRHVIGPVTTAPGRAPQTKETKCENGM